MNIIDNNIVFVVICFRYSVCLLMVLRNPLSSIYSYGDFMKAVDEVVIVVGPYTCIMSRR